MYCELDTYPGRKSRKTISGNLTSVSPVIYYSAAPVNFIPKEILLVLIYIIRLIGSEGHSAAGRIKSIKNTNGHAANRTFRFVAQCLNQPHQSISPYSLH